jgi:hypothetical protein
VLRLGAARASILTLAAAGAVAQPAGAQRPCADPTADLVAANAHVRVIRTHRHASGGAAYAPLFACRKHPRRQFRLDRPNPEKDGDRAIHVALAGRFVAVATVAQAGAGVEQFARVSVIDTRSRRAAEFEAVSPSQGPADETVPALALTYSGDIAWVSVNRAPSNAAAGVYELWLRPWAAAARRVDASSAIRPRSLALSANGRWVYWIDAGRTRAAQVPR